MQQGVVTLPNFLIVGAARCGTTMLHRTLRQHPDVYLPAQKETNYFASESVLRHIAGPGDAAVLHTTAASRSAYERHYLAVRGQKAVGEVCPSYFFYPESVRRIRLELGSPRIVVILRDPVEKAFSQYMALVRDHRETLSFREALRAEPQRIAAGYADLWHYTQGSLYAERLRAYLDVFGDAVLVLLHEQLVAAPAPALQALCHHLGVAAPRTSVALPSRNRSGRPRSVLLADFLAQPNAMTRMAGRFLPKRTTIAIRDALLALNTGAKPVLENDCREHLRARFRDDVAALEHLLGRRTGWFD